MPPRFVYWTIIAGGMPTAFRAAEREELMPTFQRLREKHPDAEMKYFAQGKLWAGPEEARAARLRRDDEGRVSGEARSDARREPRGKAWRPGGEHRDPRQKFKDAKKDRNQRWRAEKFERRAKQPSGSASPPASPKRPWTQGREGGKPHGDPLRDEVTPEWPPKGPALPPATPKRERYEPREGGDWRSRPPQQDWRSKPPRQDWRSKPPKPDWRSKPPREKPHGDPLRDESRPHWKSRPPSGPASPKRSWTKEREGGKRPGTQGREGGKRPWTQGRDSRNQEREDKPPRGPRPDREPRRGDEDPKRPPRADEPRIAPPGPPERGGKPASPKRWGDTREGGRPFRPRTDRPAGKGPRRR